ncbi:MAG: hypothetical protein AUJ92_20735 [Armatimonadetes bacterium CG2_30_59_28]|nr:hypothetical protein [Armatimonadota bacterium]OIO89752.1 MAG: hypothetical protein AUJ92_20735 [Armatimonadetes bacterium CG2_30_59_28]PIU66914.1 MAG: hypothetical protein COS85_02830 [Armatimonadetes bacterium CG07_land_8_20_14_0_80_59_28]PIX44421.1 MAG: hypothetical protein COZ56_04570 [Armatimonadetes bacterium CG_4_8_14_3_um_filter_58_9]PIY48316.1 MAG: hypothetical protein COZ05_03480 [Armatimonadetes bacterium CG_4_10_14_3_um_filter_59_10]
MALKLTAHYYQQFDADHSLDVPGEGYGGWKQAVIDIAEEHTAVVVMHAWDADTRDEFPGWYRCVEYLPRANEICENVFPPLLNAVRESGFRIFHVVGGGNYYKECPGYLKTVELAGASPELPTGVDVDDTLAQLREFRSDNVFVGTHNQEDVSRGFACLDFPPEARPLDAEPIAENAHQLLALCRHHGVNHLVYAGFAINWCLLMSSGGMVDMTRHGVLCSALRQAVTAVENKESARGEQHKEEALWRVAVGFGFIFDVHDFMTALLP